MSLPRYRVTLTAEAERDLEAIGDRIAEADPARALSFVGELREKSLDLAEFPERFPLVPRHDAQGVRHRVHGNTLIFYRVGPSEVVVIHVLHGAMDYADLLFLPDRDKDGQRGRPRARVRSRLPHPRRRLRRGVSPSAKQEGWP